MVEARKGQNPAYPYEVRVGAMVKMFADKNEAIIYAVREHDKLLQPIIKKIERDNAIRWSDDFDD